MRMIVERLPVHYPARNVKKINEYRNLNRMPKSTLLIILLLFLALSSCSQVDGLLPEISKISAGFSSVETSTSVPKQSTSTLTFSPTSTSASASPTPSPTLSPTPKATRTPRPTATQTATLPVIIKVGPNDFPDYVNPLTGLVPINPLSLERRPIAVKIPNYPHAMPDSGELAVRSGFNRSSQEVWISFADTGEGIPAEELVRIFEPLYSTKPQGTGLGLSISYGIVERHNGHIEVQSELGAGSTFTVFLPAGGAGG